jgi:hypothetical protein
VLVEGEFEERLTRDHDPTAETKARQAAGAGKLVRLRPADPQEPARLRN